MQYDKLKDSTNYVYIRSYSPYQKSGPVRPTSDLGLDGFVTFSGGTAASGVSLSTITVNYMPYREIIPSVELQKLEIGKLMQNRPGLKKK